MSCNGHETLPPDDGLPSAAVLPRGTNLGRYVILEQIGSGGMGIVYAAYDSGLERKVALKMLHHSGEGTPSQARLLREAQAMARLSHPNVSTVHDVGSLHGRVYVAMELVEGETLKTWLKSQPRTWRQVLDVFIQAGRGIAAAHAAGLVHRDIKPSNILIGRDGRARVTDFGLVASSREQGDGHVASDLSTDATASTPFEQTLTRTGALIGTPGYVAPECFRGEPATASADLFAFSVALYEALYGERPFSGASSEELVRSVFAGLLRPPPAGSRVPSWIRAAVLRGLRPDPAERWPSMDDLVTALDNDSSVRRRRIAVAGGAVALIGASLWAVLGPLAAAPCSDVRRHLDGVWDAEAKNAVRRGLLATQTAWAESAAKDVLGKLDHYTAAWVAMRKDACEDTHVHGEQSPALLDLRMRCLDRRLLDVDALVEIFSTADEKVARRASRSVARLGSLDDCADADLLSRPAPLPDDERLRESIRALEAEAARIDALGRTGRYEEALSQARAAVERARATEYRPIEAEITFLLGDAELMAGDAESAEKTIRKAILVAEAGNHDHIAAKAWARLVYATGVKLADHEQAHEWAEHAAAAAERAGSARSKSYLDSNLGWVLFDEGRYAEAAERFEASLAEREARLGPDHDDVRAALNGLASARRYQGRSDEAVELYRRALAIMTASHGEAHPATASSHGNLGLALQDRRRFEEALEHHEKALAILEKALGVEHPSVGRELVNLGLALSKLGRHAEALERLSRALPINEAAYPENHPTVAINVYCLGLAHEAAGHNEEALRLMRRALAMRVAKLGEENASVGHTRCSIGRVLTVMGKTSEALGSIQTCLRVLAAALGDSSPQRVDGLIELAQLRLATDSASLAVEPLQQALDTWGPETDPTVVAQTRFALARVAWEVGGDRSAAIDLAEDARLALSRAGDGFVDDVARIAQWLAERVDADLP